VTPYEFLEDVATADIAFAAWGGTIEETFRAAADATMNVMVEDLESIHPLERRHVTHDADGLDMLLFDYLNDLIYYKDAEVLLTRGENIAIREKDGGGFHLDATLVGERIDVKRHEFRVDVKAVTLHRFSLAMTDRGWEAMVILDI